MELEIPGYKLKRVIGKGGMARVYLAEQKVFGREVALKVMSKHLSEDKSFGKRFLREAQIVAKLVHPNIVTVHDVGCHEGHYYLSMEYIDGKDLRVRRKNLTVAQQVHAIRDIAKALAYAGKKGYVHRDIKPENIMFHDSDGRAVLTDFGIARAAKSDIAMTQTGLAIGTPHYMSPEQAKGKAVDPRSDIYSLGVVFYLLLTGKVPYDADSAVAIGIKHITEPVPVLPLAYEGLQKILDQMMAKVVDQRYQSASELIDDLDSLDLNRLQYDIDEHRGAGNIPTHLAAERKPSSFVSEESQIDTERFTVTEEAIREIRPSVMVWPWLVSFMVVCTCVSAGIYVLRPTPLIPYIDKLESWGKTWTEEIRRKAEQEFLDQSLSPEDSGAFESKIVSKAAIDLSHIAIEKTPILYEDQDRELVNLGVEVPADIENNQLETETEVLNESQSERHINPSSDIVLEKYLGQLALSHQAYMHDDSTLAQYVDAHRDLLANYPQNELALNSLKNLQLSLKGQLFESARDGKYEQANQLLTQYRYLFSNLPSEKFEELERQVQEISLANHYLIKADALFQQNLLSKPPAENAIAYYQRVLSLDPSNEKATEGLKNSLNVLAEFARENKRTGNRELSLIQAKTILTHDADHPVAITLVDSLKSQVSDDESLLSSLYQNAELAATRGDLFEPTGQNAYDLFQEILALDRENQAALDGLAELRLRLSDKVTQYLWLGELINARSILRRPLELMPDNSIVQSLSEKVEVAILEKQKSVSPVINTRVTDTYPTGHKPSNATTVIPALSARETWYLSIDYQNITAQNENINISLIQMPEGVEVFALSKILPGSNGQLVLSSVDLDLRLTKGSYQLRVSEGSRYGSEDFLGTSVFSVF